MIDFLKMYFGNNNYVRHVCLPTYVHIYSDTQLDLGLKLKSNTRKT